MHGLLENPLISVILVIAIIAFIVFRQLHPRKLSLRGLILFPAIILLVTINSLPSFHPTPTKLLDLAVTTVITITLGLLACRELHIYKRDSGDVMVKGSLRYFLWWLGAFIIKSVLAIILGETEFKTVSQIEILIPVFLLIATRNAYLYWKAKSKGFTL